MCEWLSAVVSDSENFKHFQISGFVSGKTSNRPGPSETRAVLPQAALGQLVDRLLEQRLLNFNEPFQCKHPVTLIGACKGSQPLDVAAACQIRVEKLLESGSKGAIAQADIARFYDNVDLLAVLSDLEAHGLDRATAKAVAGCQFLQQVSLRVLGTECHITDRCKATVTGSRVANACARWPVLQAMHHLAPSVHSYGVECNGPCSSNVVCLFTWIDNIYCIGRTQFRTVSCMQAFEEYMSTKWNLSIKPSSKLYMLPRGAWEEECFDESWSRVQHFPVLGHLVSDTGGIRQCWKTTQSNTWKAFWGKSS